MVNITDADDELNEMKKSIKEANERMAEKKKSAYSSPELVRIRIDAVSNPKSTWGYIDLDDPKNGITCETCRMDPHARESNTNNPTWRMFCCSNVQAQNRYYDYSNYSVSRKRGDHLELAARVKLYLFQTKLWHENVALDKYDPIEFLAQLAECMINNGRNNPHGEGLMKALSNIGEVRLDPNLARSICELSRLKQVNVLIETDYDVESRRNKFYFRLGADMGNVLYKDFMTKILNENPMGDKRPRYLQQVLEGCSAERVGDVVEMWLGIS